MPFGHVDTPPASDNSSGNASLHPRLIKSPQGHKTLDRKAVSWWFSDSLQRFHRTSPLHDSCRAMIFQLLLSAYFITAAFSIPISPHLVCEEKRWQSIFVFLATNYIAHAFTTIPFPGAKLMRHLFLSFRALLLPSIGLIEAIRSVICHFVQGGSDDLRRAVAQRALLILVKTGDITPGDIKFVAEIRSSFV